MRRWRSMSGVGWLLALSALLGCGEPDHPTLVDWPAKIPDRIVIRGVGLLDVVAGETVPSVDVVVESGRIASITPAGTAPAGGGDDVVIDGAGATLLPGLIDMHGHIVSSSRPAWSMAGPTPNLNLERYVYAGVTTVFDPSDSSGDAFERRERVARREQVGPRIFTVGPALTAPDSHPIARIQLLAPVWIAWYLAPRVAVALPDEETVSEVVDRLAAEGADSIKIVVDRIPLDAPRMTKERAAQVVERARRHGLRTVVHIGTTEDAIESGEAGVALWIHNVYKERIPDDQIATLAGFGIPMVATSEVFDSYGRARQGPRASTRLERETVSTEVLESFHPIPEDLDLGPLESWVELMAETPAIRADNVERLHDAGVTILAGSDVQPGVFAGASLHREIHNLADSGLSAIESIRAATLYAARYLEMDEDPDFGVVDVGKRADLLLVDGDPLHDLDALDSIRAVILNGVPMERTALVTSAPDSKGGARP